MSKKFIVGILSIVMGIVALVGITFMTLSLTGSISFLKNSITITTDSYQKEYDGESVDPNRYQVSGKLFGGDEISLEFFEVSSNVGTYTTYFEAKILNSSGKDVTESYNIEKNYGTLTILKREITLEVKSIEEEYNGKELTPKDYEITEGSLAEGDTLDVTLTGSITEIGEAKASLIYAVYSTKDGKEENVTSNYKVTTVDGILTKAALPLTIKSDAGAFEYDGEAHKVDTYTTPYLKVDENDTEVSHIEKLAEGDTISYTATQNAVNAGTYTNTFDVAILDSDGNDVTKNYAITKEYGNIEITKFEITIQSSSKELTYDGKTYVAALDSTYTVSEAIPANDTLHVDFVATQTGAGAVENVFYASLYDKDGNNVSDNYSINKEYGKIVVSPKPIIVSTESYQKEYDGIALENVGTVTLFDGTPLLDGDTLTGVVTGKILDAGEASNTATITIKNSDGNDVTKNYSIMLDAGKLTITKRELTLRASSASKPYDGLPLVSNGWYLISGSMAEGEYLSVTVSPAGELINPGSIPNIISYQIVNENGAMLMSAGKNYDITLIDGLLTITEAADKMVYLAPADVYVQYVDATTTAAPTGVVGFDYYEEQGYILSCVTTGSQNGLGTSLSQIEEDSIKITKAGADVTNQFNVVCLTGVLQVYTKEITILTPTLEVEYDGLAHTDDAVTITGNEGLDIVYTVTGSQTNVGTAMNTISISGVYSSTDTTHSTNLIGQYYLHISLGKITVTPKEITVTTGSLTESKANADSISLPLEDSDVALLAGHTFTQSTVTLSNIGTLQNAITIVIFDENDVDVTSNYSITYVYGTLTLTN